MRNAGASSSIRQVLADSSAQNTWRKTFKWTRLISLFLVSLLRATILISLIFVHPQMLSITIHNICFWSTSFITVALYLFSSLMDPGFQLECLVTWLSPAQRKAAADLLVRIHSESYQPPALLSSPAGVDDDSSSDEEGPPEMFGGIVVERRKEQNFVVPKPPDSDLRLEIVLPQNDPSPQSKSWRFAFNRSIPLMFFFCGVRCLRRIIPWIGLTVVPFRGYYPFTRCPDDSSSKQDIESLFSVGVNNIWQTGEKLLYCEKCQLWRPLRCKHCSDCGYCVRMYDHHCPWLGVCVGERNRYWFMIFLLLQSIELIWTEFLIVKHCVIETEWLNVAEPTVSIILPEVYLVVSCMILFCLTVLCASLLIFQLMLQGMNLTTWELLSWDRISYLRTRCKRHGSPFGSRSLFQNLVLGAYAPKRLGTSRVPEFLGLPSLGRRIWAPNGGLLWIPKTPNDADFTEVPRIFSNSCCDMFNACA